MSGSEVRDPIGHEELMRYIDGELPPDRARDVEAAMESSTELRRDYVLFSRMKTDLGALGRDLAVENDIWSTVSRRLARPMGWLLFVVGLAVWTAYGTYAYLTGADALWEKLATSAVVVGLGMLLASVLIERYREVETDPYRDIER